MKRRSFIGLVGSAAVWPLAARAQQAERMKRVGILMSTAETDPQEISSVSAFRTELAKLGWVQGKNLDLSVRWGAADNKRMTANAEELVSLGTDVILAKGATVPSAHQATTTIPIVFVKPSRPDRSAARGQAFHIPLAISPALPPTRTGLSASGSACSETCRRASAAYFICAAAKAGSPHSRCWNA